MPLIGRGKWRALLIFKRLSLICDISPRCTIVQRCTHVRRMMYKLNVYTHTEIFNKKMHYIIQSCQITQLAYYYYDSRPRTAGVTRNTVVVDMNFCTQQINVWCIYCPFVLQHCTIATYWLNDGIYCKSEWNTLRCEIYSHF